MSHKELSSQSDSRVINTRMALFRAFASLVLDRAYEDIRITHIIGEAGISRSTFYQHYKNKDDILADSMSSMFETFADAACGQSHAAQLQTVLEHFWENRNFGRIILNSPAYRRLVDELTSKIEVRLESRPDGPGQPALRLKSIALAEGQLAIIRAWLSNTISCKTEDLVTHLVS